MSDTTYVVQSFVDGRWTIRTFTQLAAAKRYADAETRRLRMGMEPIKVSREHGEWTARRFSPTSRTWILV
jgi:hypothetical protein